MNSESGREARAPEPAPLPTRAKREGPAATRRRPNPVEKRNAGDGPILSPCAAAGDVRAYVRTHS